MAREPADHLAVVPDGVGDDLALRLGHRIRTRRTALGRTLAEVASEADVSVSYLSAIELGTNVPSLPVLGRLVHALRLTLHELLREEERMHVREGDATGDEAGVTELHHPDLRLQVASLVCEPGERGPAPLVSPHATAFVFVERGALLLEVDGAQYALGQGDALDAVDVTDVRWESLGETRSVSLWGVLRAARR